MIFVCIASGPSLTVEQCKYVELKRKFNKCRVIAVNDNWRLARYADYVYACDRRWWDAYVDDVKTLTDAELWTIDKGAASAYGLKWIESDKMFGVSKNGKISHGQNSGYQAVNLAFLFGAKKIILIGYDCQHTDGKKHWFGDHPKGWGNANRVQAWAHNFKSLASGLKDEGIDVVNCSLDTALKCFRRGELEKEL